jgi:hypothetical protein
MGDSFIEMMQYSSKFFLKMYCEDFPLFTRDCKSIIYRLTFIYNVVKLLVINITRFHVFSLLYEY